MKYLRKFCLVLVCWVLCQKHVSKAGASNYITRCLWNVITCPDLDTHFCFWHNTPYLSWLIIQMIHAIYHLYSPGLTLEQSWNCQDGNTWWRHQMEIFSALLAICAGNSPVTAELPKQRRVTWSFHVYFDLRPNKRLSIQSLGWWFETLSPPLLRHRNET